MALTIDQIMAVAYPTVLAAMRREANVWAESAFMRYLERDGKIERASFGGEIPLNYIRQDDEWTDRDWEIARANMGTDYQHIYGE